MYPLCVNLLNLPREASGGGGGTRGESANGGQDGKLHGGIDFFSFVCDCLVQIGGRDGRFDIEGEEGGGISRVCGAYIFSTVPHGNDSEIDGCFVSRAAAVDPRSSSSGGNRAVDHQPWRDKLTGTSVLSILE